MVEFTPATMQKLAEMLRPPEPEILQGDDLPSAGETFNYILLLLTSRYLHYCKLGRYLSYLFLNLYSTTELAR